MAEATIVPRVALRLRWADAAGRAQERALDAGELTIGRGEGCDIIVDDARISRTHARLRVVEGEVVIEDLGSRNGTIVNGERVASAGLHAGDTLSLATVAFELLASGVEFVEQGGCER